VRCCSDIKLPSWISRRPGCSAWAESAAGLWKCSRDKTFAEAEAICQTVGARLCTVAEIGDGCTAGTGCSFDYQLVWASTLAAVA